MTPKYQPEDLRRELLYLRKGAGFTTARLGRAKATQMVLGGSTEPTELLSERFVSAIQSLHDDEAALLMDVYALTPETQAMESLASRRDHAGSRLGIGREAVADRDTAAIESLLTQLLTGWYPKSPIGIRIPESHNGVVHHSINLTTFVGDRRHLETRHHYRFFATFDGAEYVALSTALPTPPIVVGDEFEIRTVHSQGGYLHQFWHSIPMRRGHTYDLRFRVPNPDKNDPYWITEEGLAFHEPTRFASFEAIFLGDKPRLIWQYNRLTALERPGNPTKSQLLKFGDHSSVTAQLHDLYGGLFSGLAWDW